MLIVSGVHVSVQVHLDEFQHFLRKGDSVYFHAPLVSAVTRSMSVGRLRSVGKSDSSGELYRPSGFFYVMIAGKCVCLFVSTVDTSSCACLRSRLETFHWFFRRESGLGILRFGLIALFRAVFHCTRWCLPRSRLENVHAGASASTGVVDEMGMGPFTQVEGWGQLSASWPHNSVHPCSGMDKHVVVTVTSEPQPPPPPHSWFQSSVAFVVAFYTPLGVGHG